MNYCFYHMVDLDGHCSGAIVKYYFDSLEQQVCLVPYNYGYKVDWNKFTKEDVLYFVDVVPQPFEDLLKIKEIVKDVIVFDHHKSFIESPTGDQFRNYPNSCLQIGIAGCEITWKTLFPDKEMPLSVHLLGQYDSWRNENKEHWDSTVLPFQYGMRLNETDPVENYPFWSNLLTMKFQHAFVLDVVNKGNLVLLYEKLQNEKIMKSSFDYVFKDALGGSYNCLCVNSTTRNSGLFESVWDENKYDFMVAYSQTKQGSWGFSAYTTRKDKDASEIAKQFGGGGHRAASGWTIPNLIKFFNNPNVNS